MTQEPRVCQRCGTEQEVQRVTESPPRGIGDLVEVHLCRQCCFDYSQWRIDPATERRHPTIRVTPDVRTFIRENRRRPAEPGGLQA